MDRPGGPAGSRRNGPAGERLVEVGINLIMAIAALAYLTAEDGVAHPLYHARMSARRYGGTTEDYLALHEWMDFTKGHIADCRHRLFLHNAWGIFLAERILGGTLTRASDDKVLPLRPLLEDHVTQDFGRIPTLAACLAQLPPEPLDAEVTTFDQCVASADAEGGLASDYEALHRFLDWPREYLPGGDLPDGRYRRVLHNSWGVALAVQAFGLGLTRGSDGAMLDVRALAEGHIRCEYGRIPTLEEALEGIRVERWMCARAMPPIADESDGRGQRDAGDATVRQERGSAEKGGARERHDLSRADRR
jgi:hypothetical protein